RAAGFADFARHAMAQLSKTPAAHHELLNGWLERVAAGECDRLMVQMPPGSAKSTYGSILFPAYYLARHRKAQIIATGHTASLAEYFGRQVRAAILEHGAYLGTEVTRTSRAAARFFVAGGGEYFAAGVRGPITGRRADLILIDDPVKSWAEAESAALRDGLFDWYRGELSARLKPGGRVVLIMTRWHQQDLAGRLLDADPAWQCLRLPALATANDPLGRVPGAALWPDMQDEAAIARRRGEVGERIFSAMYQQEPRPPEAALFNVTKIEILAAAPALIRSVRAWDLAASVAAAGRNPDYTVGLKLGLTAEGRFVVADVVRLQAGPAQVEREIIRTAQLDGLATVLALPQDPGQAGLAQVALLMRSLAGFHVVASPETGAKLIRAMPAATQADAGNLALVAAPWNAALLAELRGFPESDKDDQVDALSRAVNTLATMIAGARRVDVKLIGR
ncbi:MAG TPA: phage terminase large subunit, partial [Acidocella sp.]|nr:phage terminase large subunit [Acidocella sp.]